MYFINYLTRFFLVLFLILYRRSDYVYIEIINLRYSTILLF